DTRSKGKVIERNQNGFALRMVGVNIDITAMKKTESDLRLAAVVFEEGEAVVITDKDGTIIRVNPAFTRTTGYSAAEAIGRKASLLKSGRHDEQFYKEFWDTLLTRGRWQGEIWNKRKNGDIYPEWETITALRGAYGEITHFIACFIDITERKEAEARVNYLAHYDELTGLYNRTLFHEQLSKALTRAKRIACSGALIFLDIDRFKSVNDTYGHTVGNELLTQVAKLLIQNIRTEDTAARLCGDEFIILLENLDRDKDEAILAVNKLALKISNAFIKPIALKQHEILISASMGICVFQSYPSTANDLIKQADMALYSAKHKGRNSIQLFEPGMEETALQRIEIESGLRFALLNKEFELFFQPQINIADGKIIGAESLLRWKHPQKGFISPAKFIPVAEDSGLILPLGAWVLESCCKQIRNWEKNGLFQGLKTLSVNISAIQFNQANFVGTVLEMIDATEINPKHLEIEITEGALITHVEETRYKLEALKKAGIRIAIDDFGTGYSSLAYLKRFPIDVLKIDQSFIRDISTDSNDAVIIKTIIGMAKNLGLYVIAEGVETEAQLEFLNDEGCAAY
ncbi:MAG: phosphodiesterase, partial [Methylovulum sp.]